MRYMESPSLHVPKLEAVAMVLIWPQPSDQGGCQVTLCQGHPGQWLPKLTGASITHSWLLWDLKANSFSQRPTQATSPHQQGSFWPRGHWSPLKEPTFLPDQLVLALEASFISGAHIPFTGEGSWKEIASPVLISFWDSLTKFDKLHSLLHREK